MATQTWITWGSYGGSSTSEQQIGSNVPSSHVYQARVHITNRTAGVLTCRVRTGSGTPGNADYYAYDASVPANDFIDMPMIIVVAGDGLYVKQSADGLSFRVGALDIA
jgi:hypothetical protein